MCGVDLLRALPDRLTPGDSYDIVLTLSDYPASAGWSLRWTLAGPQTFDKTSTASGDAHAFTLSATDTGVLVAGVYGSQLRVTDGTRVRTLPGFPATVRVDDDLSKFAPGEHDGPAWWDELIKACRAQLLNTMRGGGMLSYMVSGRQVMFQSADQVRRVLAWAEGERARMRRGSAFGKVRVNLTRGW